MQKEAIRFEKSTVFEGMTSINAILNSEKSDYNDRKIIKIIYDKSREEKNKKILNFLKRKSEECGFLIEGSTTEKIDEMTVGNSHGGIIAICSERTIPDLISRQNEINPRGFYVMIQGIEDPYNFGYSLRSLYVCGCSGIILPLRNWMSAAGVVARSSAGASELLPMYSSDAESCVDFFKNLGYSIVSADENSDMLLHKTRIEIPILLIVGGEKRGISSSLIKKSDIVVKIGYSRHFPASLSAASATTIIGYEIFRQNPSLSTVDN